MYKPCNYEFENSLNENFFNDLEIEKSLAYKNSDIRKKNNTYNILSQIYSRNKVRDLFNFYVEKNNVEYDMVISTRFDGFLFPINYSLNDVDKTKIYTSSIHCPRFIIPDSFLIIPIEIYLKWFDLYKNCKNIINNTEINKKINEIGEKLEINMEEYLLANYLYYYDMKHFVFDNKI